MQRDRKVNTRNNFWMKFQWNSKEIYIHINKFHINVPNYTYNVYILHGQDMRHYEAIYVGLRTTGQYEIARVY